MLFVIVVILYALSAVYFAGVMVRLMLTLTPVVCVLAAIAFSKTFEVYLKDDSKTKTVDTTEGEKEKNGKYYDKVINGDFQLKVSAYYPITYRKLKIVLLAVCIVLYRGICHKSGSN